MLHHYSLCYSIIRFLHVIKKFIQEHTFLCVKLVGLQTCVEAKYNYTNKPTKMLYVEISFGT